MWHLQRDQLLKPGSIWVWLSVALYALACVLPAMPPIIGENPIPGWVCLTSLMITFPAWWANPCYFLAIILYCVRYIRAATVFACIAAPLAFSFEVIDFPSPGWMNGLTNQEIGCYLWVSSLQIMAINLIWMEWLAWRERQQRLNLSVVESTNATKLPTS